MDSGSDVVTEVEIQPEMEEVEIESIPVDMHLSGDDDTLAITPDDVGMSHEAMLESQDDDEYDDHGMSLEDGLLLDQEEEEDEDGEDAHAGPSHFHHVTIPSYSHHPKRHNRQLKGTSNLKKRFGSRMLSVSDPNNSNGHHLTSLGPNNANHLSSRSSKKWEPKQVQIRTLEGAFSVTMWASGADDGKQ